MVINSRVVRATHHPSIGRLRVIIIHEKHLISKLIWKVNYKSNILLIPAPITIIWISINVLRFLPISLWAHIMALSCMCVWVCKKASLQHHFRFNDSIFCQSIMSVEKAPAGGESSSLLHEKDGHQGKWILQ